MRSLMILTSMAVRFSEIPNPELADLLASKSPFESVMTGLTPSLRIVLSADKSTLGHNIEAKNTLVHSSTSIAFAAD